jgi:hypothetical protein
MERYPGEQTQQLRLFVILIVTALFACAPALLWLWTRVADTPSPTAQEEAAEQARLTEISLALSGTAPRRTPGTTVAVAPSLSSSPTPAEASSQRYTPDTPEVVATAQRHTSGVRENTVRLKSTKSSRALAAATFQRTPGAHEKTIRIRQDFSSRDPASTKNMSRMPMRFAALASTVNNDGQLVYDQCDTRWGETPFDPRTACLTGCGPTAMAMIMSALKQQPVLPQETIDYARENGLYEQNSGAAWALPAQMARAYGLASWSVPASVAEVNAALAKGAMVWMCGGGNMGGAAPFTDYRHCIAVRGQTASGRWKVFDSKSGRDPDASYDPDDVIQRASAGSVTAVAPLSSGRTLARQ